MQSCHHDLRLGEESYHGVPRPMVSPDARHDLIPEVPSQHDDTAAVLWPLRYALSGQERSPDPFTLISILGTTETISRIRKAIAILEG